MKSNELQRRDADVPGRDGEDERLQAKAPEGGSAASGLRSDEAPPQSEVEARTPSPSQGFAQRDPRPHQAGMPDALKAGIEALSGFDMSGVRVHANSGKPAQLNALALAQGNDIHLGSGQEMHLPPEAWHVVQQRQGCVLATRQIAGGG